MSSTWRKKIKEGTLNPDAYRQWYKGGSDPDAPPARSPEPDLGGAAAPQDDDPDAPVADAPAPATDAPAPAPAPALSAAPDAPDEEKKKNATFSVADVNPSEGNEEKKKD